MSDWVLSLIFAAGAGGFVYSRMMKITMRQEASISLAAVCGLVGFIVIFSLAKILGF